jgi:hypothetical protein
VVNPSEPNFGSAPTIINGVVTNIPIGIYTFFITGSLNMPFFTCQLQYKPTGGNFKTIAENMYMNNSNKNSISFSISANITISSRTDSFRFYYPRYHKSLSESKYTTRITIYPLNV